MEKQSKSPSPSGFTRGEWIGLGWSVVAFVWYGVWGGLYDTYKSSWLLGLGVMSFIVPLFAAGHAYRRGAADATKLDVIAPPQSQRAGD